tara:strand:+ start:1428 stop:1538 length:111 start_codon:yes stop_codon:yes gene_type:complete
VRSFSKKDHHTFERENALKVNLKKRKKFKRKKKNKK